jgi:hypothetical protein
MSARRRAFGLTARRCALRALAPTLATAIAAVAWHRAWSADAAAAPGAASPWLGLPLAIAALATTLTAVVFWPTFAQKRPGRAVVERLQPGPLAGAGAAAAGALAATAALTLPLAAALAPALGAPATAFAVHALTPVGDGLLDGSQPRLALRCPTRAPVRELRLQPLVGMPTESWQATAVRVFADGVELPPLPSAFADSRQAVRLAFPPQPVREFELVHAGGGMPLAFDADAAAVAAATPHPALANALAVGLLALLPAFVALGLAALVGSVAPLATTLATAASAVFLLTVGGVGPFQPAVVAVLRGEWLATAAVFRAAAASLAVGAAAMIAAMAVRAQDRR